MYFRDDDMIDDDVSTKGPLRLSSSLTLNIVHEGEKRLYLCPLCQPPSLAIMGHSTLEGIAYN
jgi:hypothetical protein